MPHLKMLFLTGSSLYAVFESGAGAYSDAKEVITDVRCVDIAQLIAQL